MLREVKFAGMVPVPVAAMTAGSACCRSHSMVSPSDLWPNSRVSWKTRAAHRAGIRILRPRPSTLVCRSFVDALFTAGFLLLLFSAAAATVEVVESGRAGPEEEEEMAREGKGVVEVEEVVVEQLPAPAPA